MWPTEQTLPLLLFGTLPLAYVAAKVARNPAEFISLRTCGTLLVWVGYQLSAWIAYMSNLTPKNFVLVPSFIDEGLLFSTMCLLCFLCGHGLVCRRARARSLNVHLLDFPVPRSCKNLVLGFIALSLALASYGRQAPRGDGASSRNTGGGGRSTKWRQLPAALWMYA